MLSRCGKRQIFTWFLAEKNEELNIDLYPTFTYRVSQDECARLRESVPYVKVYRYNPKHLYPKLKAYGDNGQRKCGLFAVTRTAPVQLTRYMYTAHVLETRMQSTLCLRYERLVTCRSCKNAFCAFPRGIL